MVSDYGANNTGATYAKVNIQNAINACGTGDTMWIPDGTYLLNNGLNLKSDMTVIIKKKALIQERQYIPEYQIIKSYNIP